MYAAAFTRKSIGFFALEKLSKNSAGKRNWQDPSFLAEGLSTCAPIAR